MADVFKGQSFRAMYAEVAQRVLRYGEPASPRGQETREIIDVILEIDDPTYSLLDSTIRPSFSPAIAAAEAAQLIAGVSDPGLMVRISKNFASFRNAGIFMGAYGPRVRTQLPELVNRLKKDANSRQAVITLWRPQDDLWSQAVADIPCTVMFQFLIRNDKLIMHTTMRSNDVWWGLTYDAFQFTQLQCTIAAVLGVEPGKYYHHAVSMHCYDRDYDKIEALSQPLGPDRGRQLNGFCGLTMQDAMANAESVLTSTAGRTDDPTVLWYADTLSRFWE